LTLDANLEGLEPLEISTIVNDGHAPNPKKQNKYEISNVNRKFQEV
jgi:hypothetical protein